MDKIDNSGKESLETFQLIVLKKFEKILLYIAKLGVMKKEWRKNTKPGN